MTNENEEPSADNLRLEYQCAQDSAQHHDTILWETAAIVWGANTLLLGFVLEAIDTRKARPLILLTAILGILLTYVVMNLMKSSNVLRNQKYERCKRIE